METKGKYYYKGGVSGASFTGIRSAMNDAIFQLGLHKDFWEEEKGFLSIKIRFVVSSDNQQSIMFFKNWFNSLFSNQ